MTSKTVPTPYMWAWQPQSGHAAGAAQDYSTRINWLSAGPAMINRVTQIRDLRNQILMTQAELTETPRLVMNPPTWPAAALPQNIPPPVTLALPRNFELERQMANVGLQLAGGARARPDYNLSGCRFSGSGIQLSEPELSASTLRPDGLFQLAGGSRSSFDPTQALLTLQQSSSQPRSGGIGSRQFVREFVPEVYLNPYSGPPDTFPDQFMPNYDIVTDSVNGYD
uniref:Pre-hexon-linking protein VIII n=1 Tax=Cardioderma bat adenovirus TaxID=3141913 RepID=A0AAU7E206_9ADEN